MDANEIKATLHGQWEDVFRTIIPQISDAIDKAPKGLGVTDPVKGGKDGFRLFKDWKETGGSVTNPSDFRRDGIATIAYVDECSYSKAMKYLIDYINGKGYSVSKEKAIPIKESKPIIKHRLAKSMNNIWFDLGRPLSGTLGEEYLLNRGLKCIYDLSPWIRFVDKLEHRCPVTNKLTNWPGIVSMFTNGYGRPQTLHRIFLDPRTGLRAPVEANKSVMGAWDGRSLSGGSIKIGSGGKCVNVAEAVETGLAVLEATGIPLWSTYSSSILSKVILDKNVEHVVIWVDKDRSKIIKGKERGRAGERESWKLGTRLKEKGKKVTYMVPPFPIKQGNKSIDWLDVYASGEHQYFDLKYGSEELDLSNPR